MTRVLQFLQWQAGWWRSIGDTSNVATRSEMQREGLVGYANRQAALRDSLAAHFSQLWSAVPKIVMKAHASTAQTPSDVVDDSGS